MTYPLGDDVSFRRGFFGEGLVEGLGEGFKKTLGGLFRRSLRDLSVDLSFPRSVPLPPPCVITQ